MACKDGCQQFKHWMQGMCPEKEWARGQSQQHWQGSLICHHSLPRDHINSMRLNCPIIRQWSLAVSPPGSPTFHSSHSTCYQSVLTIPISLLTFSKWGSVLDISLTFYVHKSEQVVHKVTVNEKKLKFGPTPMATSLRCNSKDSPNWRNIPWFLEWVWTLFWF